VMLCHDVPHHGFCQLAGNMSNEMNYKTTKVTILSIVTHGAVPCSRQLGRRSADDNSHSTCQYVCKPKEYSRMQLFMNAN